MLRVSPEDHTPRREIHCEEAMTWLSRQEEVLRGASVVTSLPDVSETGMSLAAWRVWFVEVATGLVRRAEPGGVAIFYQTDIKAEGAWVDKGYLCQRAAEAAGAALLWHRIALRKPAGTVTFGRPTYTHLLCFSRELREETAESAADVFDAGAMTWPRAMGLRACEVACRYVLKKTATRTVVDPFCGRGSVLAVANALGLDAVGVDWSPKRCRQAAALQLDLSAGPSGRTAPPGPRGPRRSSALGRGGGAATGGSADTPG